LKINESHEDVFFDDNRFLISYGGAGSGKSVSVGQKHLMRLVTETPHRFLICRKVGTTLRPSVFQLMKDLIANEGLYSDFKINKTDMTITHIPTGNEMLFMGLDDIEKLKSIVGITGIWIEEASECDENDVAELNRRLRGETKHYKQIILTFNPISHLHWLKARFFDNPASTASIYKSTYLDNAFIDNEYKAEIEAIKNYDVQQYNIYALGEWGVLNTNIVYHNFIVDKHVTRLTLNDFDVLHIGLDFNIGSCAVVVCGILGDAVHVVDIAHPYDTDAIVSHLMKYKSKQLILYPDASGGNRTANAPQSSIDILRQAGHRIEAPSVNGPVRDRINAVNRLLAQDRLLVSDKCEKLRLALQTQAYDKKGNPEKADNHMGGSFDDWNDALGYFIVRRFPIRKPVTRVDASW
jgi:phage terminase large subunit